MGKRAILSCGSSSSAFRYHFDRISSIRGHVKDHFDSVAYRREEAQAMAGHQCAVLADGDITLLGAWLSFFY